MVPATRFRRGAARAIALLPWILSGSAVCAPADSVESIGAIRIILPPQPSSHEPVFTEADLREDLRRYVGSPCDGPTIEEAIGRRYRFLGYVPTVRAECDRGTLELTVRESSHRIALITFDPEELGRIGVSADPDVRDPRPLFPVPPGAPRALLRGLLSTVEGDLYNAERYRSDSESAGLLGFAVAFIPGPETGPDAYPAGAYLVQSLVARTGGRGARGGRTNYVGGTASYAPREKGRVGVVYRKRALFGQFDRFSFSPTYGVALGGALNYAAPILSDREDPKRLYDLEFTTFSSFRNDRLLAGVETDERRTGAALALGLRPLGIRAPHDLRFRWAVEHTRIDLEEEVPGLDEVDLTLLRMSAAYEWRRTHRSPSLSARMVPAVEVAFDDVGGARSFVRSSLDAALHGRSPAGLEFDLHLVAGTIDHAVPEFELWDLGGATTVRGFRDDSFLGRHRVALQSEIWIPFARPLPYRALDPGEPIARPGDIPIERRSARMLKGALFLDGGYLSGTASGRNETLVGAGVGLRFVVPHQPLVIRIDYGWGLGGRGGDAFPYVSLGYRF